MNLIIHAPNVHQGGGRTLLLSLLAAVGGHECTAILDARLRLPADLPSGVNLVLIAPTLLGRFKAEWCLRQLVRKDDVVLCFGNLPPVFKNLGSVSVFLQNRYLLLRHNFSRLPIKQSLRIAVERLWLRVFLRDVTLIVQTQSMAIEALRVLGRHSQILPFTAQINKTVSHGSRKIAHDLIYVASGEPHKNHRILIEAWMLLAKDGLRPSLALTLDPNSARPLMTWIESMSAQHGLDIKNLGILNSEQICELYGSAKAMVYPSCFESFGLPLIEAAYFNLPILAPELDYVRDVCIPVETFDPNSAVSISRAVRRFLGKPDCFVNPVSPGQFLESIKKYD